MKLIPTKINKPDDGDNADKQKKAEKKPAGLDLSAAIQNAAAERAAARGETVPQPVQEQDSIADVQQNEQQAEREAMAERMVAQKKATAQQQASGQQRRKAKAKKPVAPQPVSILFGSYESHVPDLRAHKAIHDVKWRNGDRWNPAAIAARPLVHSAAGTSAPVRVFFLEEQSCDKADAMTSFIIKMLKPGEGPCDCDPARARNVVICAIAGGSKKEKLEILDDICHIAQENSVEVSVVYDEAGELDELALIPGKDIAIAATPGEATMTAYYNGDLSVLDPDSVEICNEDCKAAIWLFAVRHLFLTWCDFEQNNNSHFPMALDPRISDILSCCTVDFPDSMEDIDANGNKFAYVCDEYEIEPRHGDICFCLAKRDLGIWSRVCRIVEYGAKMYACVQLWEHALEKAGMTDQFPPLVELFLGRDMSSGKMLDITALQSGYPDGMLSTGDNRQYDRLRELGRACGVSEYIEAWANGESLDSLLAR